MAKDFEKDADEIATLYVELVKKKLKEEDVDAVVKLVGIADRIADLSELLVQTAEAQAQAEADVNVPSRRGRRGPAAAPPPTHQG